MTDSDEGPVADAARRVASWSGDKVGVYKTAKKEIAAAMPTLPDKPIITWQPLERYEITGRGTLFTGPYPFDDQPALVLGRQLLVDGVQYTVMGTEQFATAAPLRRGNPCAVLVKPTPEHWAIEQVKRIVIKAMVGNKKGDGMAVTARRATDDILELLVPNEPHRRML
jgi:hypothetical protein